MLIKNNYLHQNYKTKTQKKKLLLIIITISTLAYLPTSTKTSIQENHEALVETAIVDYTREFEEELRLYKQAKIARTPKVKKAIPEYDIPLDEELQHYIYDLCEEYDIEYELFLALIHHESKFDNNAIGKNRTSTDHGLTQINSRNEKWINELAGREMDITNEKDNILAGMLIYNHYKTYWKDKGYDGLELQQRVLLSYNRGLSGSKKYIASRGLNAGYIRKVMESKDIIVNSNNQ